MMMSAKCNRREQMLVKIIFLIVSTIILTAIHYLVSCKVDYLIAKWMGDIQKMPASGWTSYGNIDWIFSSILGPVWALHIYIALLLCIFSGLFASLILFNYIFNISPILGTHYWLVIAISVTWIIRIPVPIRYSLYYFTSVHY